MTKTQTPKMPKLRFPGFSGEWEEKKLGDFAKTVNGLTYSPKDIREDGILVLRSSNIKNGRLAFDDCVYVDETLKHNKSEKGDILICVRNGSQKLIGKNVYIDQELENTTHGAFMTVLRSERNKFISQLFQTRKYYKQVSADLGARINSINNSQLLKYKFYLPKDDEQQKIAGFLGAVDDRISALQKKVELLKKYKKGIMQQIFPPSHKATEGQVPEIRFKGFTEKWQEMKLGQLLDYEQPTKYIVESTEYSDQHKTPVLTAGKTFILGYTNEKEGIYDKDLPVIIFDDFTTASHYVDFPFKVKSSAMKILKPRKGTSAKVVYELMKKIKFAANDHKRYWIGTFQDFDVQMPSYEEQQKIADFLMSIDDKIELTERELEQAKQFKKALLQQMFV